MTTAILAVQGAFVEHRRKLEALGEPCFELRTPSDLDRQIDRLVLPGGESTAQAKLLRVLGLFNPLAALIADGTPVLGTCAGLILLSRGAVEPTVKPDRFNVASAKPPQRKEPLTFGTLDVHVARNAYGRQLDSFHACAMLEAWQGTAVEPQTIPLTFIRAPKITETGNGVEVLARHEGTPVAVRQEKQIGVAFHPELDEDDAIHQLFLSL